MKIKIAVLLSLLLCLNAHAINQYLSVKVTGADHASYKFTPSSQPVNMTIGSDYEVYPGTTVSISVNTCVLSNTNGDPKPRIVLKLERAGGSGFTAIWTDIKELNSGLGMDLGVYESVNLDKCWLTIENQTPCHSYDPVPPVFAPPQDEDEGDESWPPDWTDWMAQTNNESFPGNLVVGTQSTFPNYPDATNVFVHVQMIPYNDNVDFETFEIGYDALLGPDAGPFDTGLAGDYQTWVRSRFEQGDGTPISGWSVTEVINPLPAGPGGP